MLSTFWDLLPLAGIGLAAIYAAVVWYRRRMARTFDNRYDLRDLREPSQTGWYDAVSGGPGEEPDADTVNEALEEDSGPYCVSCGVGYPAGTPACRQCGRTF